MLERDEASQQFRAKWPRDTTPSTLRPSRGVRSSETLACTMNAPQALASILFSMKTHKWCISEGTSLSGYGVTSRKPQER